MIIRKIKKYHKSKKKDKRSESIDRLGCNVLLRFFFIYNIMILDNGYFIYFSYSKKSGLCKQIKILYYKNIIYNILF